MGIASFGSGGGSSSPYEGPGTAGRVRRAVGRDIRPEHTFGRRLGAQIRQTEPGPDVPYRTGLPARRQQR